MRIESFILDGHSAVEHLALEAALLGLWSGDGALLLFYMNDACLVVGRNQNPWKEVSPDSKLPVFRRDSGGGTVYHDKGNLNWALILPRNDHDKDSELALIAGALREIGYPVEPGERGGLYCGPESPCPGFKISGTARRFGKENVLHHGTLLVSSDLRALGNSLGGIETYDDRSLPSVPAQPVNILSIGPFRPPEALAEALSLSLSGRLPARLPSTPALQKFADKERTRLESLEWIFGATPRFSFKFPHKGDEFLFTVEEGRVLVPEAYSKEYFSRFAGIPFTYKVYLEMKKAAQLARRSKEART